MPKIVPAAFVCLLAVAAFGQWSEPVVLGDSCVPWFKELALIPARADTVWAVWGRRAPDYHYFLVARRFAGDSWAAVERLTPDSGGLAYPTGILDDSGRVLVAYYDGFYPISGSGEKQPWAICTVTRTDTGWTRPQPVHEMWEGFPFDIRLGHDRRGGVAMTWEEGPGGMHHTGSVMFSRKTPEGWTPRRCFAVGCTTSYGGASLIPGDTTDFYLAFSGARLWSPFTCTLQVWAVDDSLVAGPMRFVGGAAPLVRTRERRHLVLRRRDTLFGSVNRGSGWQTPVVIGTGHGVPSPAADSLGYAWLAWTDSLGQAVLASFHAGNFWSRPETVALGQYCGNPQIAADECGRVHCCWLGPGTGGLVTVRWAYRLARPGVAETSNAELRTTNGGATIVRGVLRMGDRIPETGYRAELLDIAGRKVMKLVPGENDVRHFAPGVYFIREAQAQAQAQAIRRVMIVR